MRQVTNKLTVFLCLVFLSLTAYGQVFTSTDYQTNLVELYTSEGCSSCPPTDDWLSNLQNEKGLWTDFVPVAFHVDYWDFIGWKDRFADQRFSERQYRYANSDRLNSVYTPGILINGHEWRRRPWNRLPKAKLKAQGKLTLTVDDTIVSAQFNSAMKKNQTLILNIALLGFDQISTVNTGENSGKKLKHNFVVLDYRTVAMQPTNDGFVLQPIAFNRPIEKGQRLALASWVSHVNNQTPLQATGGWLQ